MYKSYSFPLQIFLILEKNQINFFSSKKQGPNTINFFIPQNLISNIVSLFKNELLLANCTLIENSAIDASYLKKSTLSKIKNIVFYSFYFFNLKNKINLFYFLNNDKKSISIDSWFNNSNWLERETSEMYNLNFSSKKDTRKLLLDYTSSLGPLIKTYPVEGTTNYYFNFFENQVTTQNIEL